MSEVRLEPVSSLSRREAVISEIRRGIVTGALQPGAKLTEVGLAAALQVSRATVREALGQLGREGLLSSEPYSGVRVAELDGGALRDLARTRVALDRLAITAIIDDATGGRMARLTQAWRIFEAQIFHDDPVVRHDAHLTFHRELWAAAENVVLTQLWPVVEANLTIALAEDQRVRPNPERSHRIHSALVTAILARDRDAVETALLAHTIATADELVDLCHPTEPITSEGNLE